MPIIDPAIALSTRQEAFCRHYAVSGNAADAARQAGYSERSARQTGCALLERPWIVERLRRIRLSWKRTGRDEARILLARLEQAWDAAVASGSACMMLRVLRFQAEIAGLVGPAGQNSRARLWPLPHEDEFGEIEAGEAQEVGTEPGPLAEAVRSGLDRARCALARHCESREELEAQEGFDGAAHDEVARRLAGAVEERMRLPVSFGPPSAPANDLPLADDPPEETYEDDPWRGDDPPGHEDRINDNRADGAEHDWLYQRRNGYAEIYDPWAPDEVEERRRDRIEWEERRCGNDPFDEDDENWAGDDDEDEENWDGDDDDEEEDWTDDDEDGPEDGDFLPDHDKT